jgi:hypothetical protein
VDLQPLENKVLSWGIIGKSAPILAEITIRKSQICSLYIKRKKDVRRMKVGYKELSQARRESSYP